MKKKVLASLLAGYMVLGSLTACGGRYGSRQCSNCGD